MNIYELQQMNEISISGISFSWPDEDEQQQFDVPFDIRFAFINGQIWQQCHYDQEKMLDMARVITEATGHRPNELDGFTLWWHPQKKGYQMSVRRKGEDGWDIKMISVEEAQQIFYELEAKHPDGPITVKPLSDKDRREFARDADPDELADELLDDEAEAANVRTCRHGIALSQDCGECDEDDGQDGVPVRADAFEHAAATVRQENDRLKAALARNAAARERLTAAMSASAARVVAG